MNAELTLTLQYFALLRELAGNHQEQLVTHARTPRELYAELAVRHRFPLTESQLKVAINNDFGDWDQPLNNGDTITFIPPVAGG